MRGSGPRAPAFPVTLDRFLLLHGAAWAVVTLVGLGIVTAIIPNPVFGRGLPAEPFAVAVWIASAPLMGLVLATYTAPLPRPVAQPLAEPPPDGGRLGAVGGFAAFLAVGCPTCNKVALLLLGAGGATSVFGPIQPVIGAAGLALLVVSLAWRLRLRARGGACESR